MLLRDPTSWLQADKNEWKYPVSQDWIILSHLYDLTAAANSRKKPKPYPTPWPDPSVQKIGPKIIQPRKTVLEKLDRMNPSKE